MSNRRYWYVGQLVTAQEWRGSDADMEQGIYDLATDAGFVGLISGGNVEEHAGTPNLTVDVAALLARSPLGERIRVAGTAIVDCEFDYLEQPTAVTTPGNSRFVDVYAVFDREGSDPRIDATNNTVFFVQSESFAFEVRQGAEALSPAAPAGPSDGVLLARITLTHGQTTITNVDIDTTVKQSVVKLEHGSLAIESGTFIEALDQLFAEYEGHVSGSGSHPATAITYAGGAAWKDGTTNPGTTVELQLDKIVSDLVLTSGGASGAHKIGCANSSAWADGTSIVGSSVYALADGIITTLAVSTGASKIGIGARTAWLGGRTNPAITAGGGVFAAVDKIITDLAATTSNDDGMERIGGQAVASSPYSLSSGSARSQATELLGFVNAAVRIRAKTSIQLVAPTSFSAAGEVELVAGSLTGTVHGTSYTAPHIITKAAAGAGNWHSIELALPRGTTLQSVEVETSFSMGSGAGATTATYDVFRWKVTTSGLTIQSLRSGGVVTDDHTLTGGGENYTDIRTQTITCDQNNSIDTSEWRYGLRVVHPFGAVSGDARLKIHEIRLVY